MTKATSPATPSTRPAPTIAASRSVHRKRSDPFPPPGPARVSQTRTVSAAPRRIVTMRASLGLRRSQPRRGRGRTCICVGAGFERFAGKRPHGPYEALERLAQFPSPAQDSCLHSRNGQPHQLSALFERSLVEVAELDSRPNSRRQLTDGKRKHSLGFLL